MHSYEVLSFSENKSVTVELVKRNENHDAMVRISSFDVIGHVQGIWKQQPHLLFFGDSITTGYGNESDTRVCTNAEIQETTNARVSYASLTAKALDASRTLVAYSGLGLLRNWNGTDSYHNLPYYQNKSGAIWGGGE